MARPINETQRRFSVLCAHGGGAKGGPVKHKVLELLRATGQEVNRFAYTQTRQHFAAYATANPWHVCFAVGLAWGHLARLDVAFTGHVVDALTELNDQDLQAACRFHLERGPEPIRKSLLGAYSFLKRSCCPLPCPTIWSSCGRRSNAGFDPSSVLRGLPTSEAGTPRRCSWRRCSRNPHWRRRSANADPSSHREAPSTPG